MCYNEAMQKGQAQVLILAGIVLVLALAGGIFFLGRITVPKPQPQNVATSSSQLSSQVSTTIPTPTPSPTTTPTNVNISEEVQIGYETVRLHSGKNSFDLEILVLNNIFRPIQAIVYDASGKVLQTYKVSGPWDSLCFGNQKVYRANGTMDEIPGYKNVEISLVNDKNETTTAKKRLGEMCTPGIKIE